MITSAKIYTRKKTEKRTDRTLGQRVKAKLYRQNLTQKHIHIHSQKKGKGEELISPAPRVHLLNLG